MDQRRRGYVAGAGIVVIFVLVQVGALALVGPFDEAGYRAVEDPQDPTNSLLYVLVILLATGAMLAVIRFGVDSLLRLLLVGAGAYIGLFVFRILAPPVATVVVPGVGDLNLLAWGAAAALGVALWAYPEWYVIDAAGIVMGAGAAGLFGISFGVLPALLLLAVLAVYDAVSVYGTEHMLTLASGVMDLKVPIVLVVPLSLSYSYLDAELPDAVADHGEDGDADDGGGDDGDDTATTDDPGSHEGITDRSGPEAPETAAGATGDGGAHGETDRSAEADETATTSEAASADEADEGESSGPFDRDALFIGLGDAVIPTVLVASAAFFAPASMPTVDLFGLAAPISAVTAMVGTVAGLVVLLRMVLKGRAHAGLPLLNGGTIAGYLVGALAGGLSLVQALGIGPYL